jgi:hypothetical protein
VRELKSVLAFQGCVVASSSVDVALLFNAADVVVIAAAAARLGLTD